MTGAMAPLAASLGQWRQRRSGTSACGRGGPRALACSRRGSTLDEPPLPTPSGLAPEDSQWRLRGASRGPCQRRSGRRSSGRGSRR
eukprot:scaffold28353_cov129-Isochrysis_galbana.AAC.1